jgi:hypothetical protein
MSQINPFVGAIAQTPQSARLAQIDRDQQVRKTLSKQRTEGFEGQNVDEFVESADAIEAVGDEDQHTDPRKRKSRRQPSPETTDGDDTSPRLDIRA